MVKIFKPKHLDPQEVLEQVHKSGVINYIFSWGYTIDAARSTIAFNLRYTGGEDTAKEEAMMQALDRFIASVDVSLE